MSIASKLEPKIRFPEFSGPWKLTSIESVLEKQSTPVDVQPDTEYTQIGLRSHGKGIFHKKSVTGESLGSKRVFWIKPDCLVMNIVFAWEQAVGKTSEQEQGLIASHRFPMYAPKEKRVEIDFLLTFFLRPRGKFLLGLASPGGAGRNRTLGQKEFDKLKVVVPTLPEQQKIADFLTAVDERIAQLKQKKALLTDYKKGVMQQLFTQAIRFKDDHGNDFPDWEEKRFIDVFLFSSGKNIKQAEASAKFRTPCIRYGELYHMYDEVITTVINRTNIEESELVFSDGDEILLPSAGEDPLDIGSASALTLKGIAIGRTINVLKPKNTEVYDQVFVSYYINQVLRKKISTLARGASISNVYNSDLKKLDINLPDLKEQNKIADFLFAIDNKIESVSTAITETQTFKRGLLQQMFV